MICSGKERFFADLFTTRRRRIKSELTQHPFLNVDRLLEKPRNSSSEVFRFLGSVQLPSASRSDALACMLALAQDKTAKISALYLNSMQTKTHVLCSSFHLLK